MHSPADDLRNKCKTREIIGNVTDSLHVQYTYIIFNINSPLRLHMFSAIHLLTPNISSPSRRYTARLLTNHTRHGLCCSPLHLSSKRSTARQLTNHTQHELCCSPLHLSLSTRFTARQLINHTQHGHHQDSQPTCRPPFTPISHTLQHLTKH